MDEQLNILDPVPMDRFQILSKDELITYIHGHQDLFNQVVKQNRRLELQIKKEQEQSLLLQEQFLLMRDKLFGRSSERLAAPETVVGADIEGILDPSSESLTGASDAAQSQKIKKKRILLPSERYPNAPLVERDVAFAKAPLCSCCGLLMRDSGMTEDSEYIEKIPASYRVIREKKHKFNCSTCHGDIQTTPALPRIKPGSAYSDETIIDVGVSKFCDLIPIGRQVKIAERLGFAGLPPQSLIETTHYLADFLRPIYGAIKLEAQASKVLYADETPHRMLEGDEKSHWYFWGFSGAKSAYFEAHDTRSGDVSIEFLKNSKCKYLMSDVYSGYKRTTTEVNKTRALEKKPLIKKIYCNAHARRKFKEALVFSAESQFFIARYQKIYLLETSSKEKPPDEIKELRAKMTPIFEEMKAEALRLICGFSSKSAIVKAIQYFLKNYSELTLFTQSALAPIDNNHQERLLRNPVIGRKTWYGTHSIRGAETTAVLFSIIESCKLNKVNPRTYLAEVTKLIHASKPAITPSQLSLN